MKKITLFTLLFVGVFLSNCQKESFKSNEQKQETTNALSNQQPVDFFKPKNPNKPSLKNIEIPRFDFENPSYYEHDSLSVITYLGEANDNQSTDNWAYHSFSYSSKTGNLNLIYHYYKDGFNYNSDVYDESGEYLFTYIDNGEKVVVDYLNPQGLPQEFYWCVEWNVNHYALETLVFGAPAYTYIVASCYYEWCVK